MTYKAFLFSTLVSVSAIWPAVASAGDTYIVRNPGSRRPVIEASRDADPRVRLAEGEVAVIYRSDGAMSRIQGPYDDRASARDRATVQNSDLFGRVTKVMVTSREQRSLGAVRAGGGVVEVEPPADLGLVDVSISTDPVKQCYYQLPVRLWRAKTDQQDEVVLSAIGGASAVVKFASGSYYAEWPKAVGLSRERGEYVISTLDGRTPTHKFTLEQLKLDTPEDLTLASLVGQDCEQQAKLAANRLVATAP